jgi:excisionase family DNA binding protein
MQANKNNMEETYHGRLETFRQLLFDQLMPWLPENNDDLFYRSWQQSVFWKQEQYLSFLIDLFRQNNRRLPPALVSEWAVFSKSAKDEEAFHLLQSFLYIKISKLKVSFYHQLLGQAFYGSYKHFIQLTATLQGDKLSYALHRYGRQLDDLIAKSQQLCANKEGDDLEITYMALMLLLLLRREVLKRFDLSLYPTNFKLLEPEVPSPEQLSADRDAERLWKFYKWFNSTATPVHKKTMQAEAEDRPGKVFTQMQKELPEKKALSTNDPAETVTTISQKAYYNTSEVAQLLGYTENTIRNMAKRNELPFQRFGKNYKFHKKDIDQLMDK